VKKPQFGISFKLEYLLFRFQYNWLFLEQLIRVIESGKAQRIIKCSHKETCQEYINPCGPQFWVENTILNPSFHKYHSHRLGKSVLNVTWSYCREQIRKISVHVC
jgi:hypothetical protein